MAYSEFGLDENLQIKKLEEECFLNGTERNTKASAAILHRLAMVYKESHSSVDNMIKSAILLHAALTRNPDNVADVRSDVKRLWHKILRLAKAKNKSFPLNTIHIQLKNEVKAMRKSCLERLEQMKKHLSKVQKENPEGIWKAVINSNQALQQKVMDDFCKILANIYDKCVKVMGPPPCKFAVIGMGKLARKEITPYSNFRHSILIGNKAVQSRNSQTILNYFAWLSALFQVAIISLEETPVTPGQIRGLDWFTDVHTKPGLSCSFRKQSYLHESRHHASKEFVLTADQILAQFTDEGFTEESDVYLSTCLLFGNESLYKTLVSKRQVKMDSLRMKDRNYFQNLKLRLAEDKRNLETIKSWSFLHSSEHINYKQIINHSVSAYIVTLGAMYGVMQSCAFDIIRKLFKKKIINDSESTTLTYVFAVTLECQVRICMKNLRRDTGMSREWLFRESISELRQAVGSAPLVEAFSTAICLQSAISHVDSTASLGKRLPLKLEANGPKLKPVILCALHLDSKCLEVCRKRLKTIKSLSRDAHRYRFLQAISNYKLNNPDEALKLFRVSYRNLSGRSKERIACFYYQALCYIKKSNFKMAVSFLQTGYRIQMDAAIEEGNDTGLVRFLFQLGCCSKWLNQVQEALDYFERGLEIRRAFPGHFKDNLEASWLMEIGRCYYRLGNLRKAEMSFDLAVRKCKMATLDERTDNHLANILYNLACTKKDQEYFEEALSCFEEELEIRQSMSDSSNKDIADCQDAIEQCRNELQITTIL